MTTGIIIKALKNAYVSQSPQNKVILHTDLGSQYTSHDFKDLTLDLNMIQSFSIKDVLTIMIVYRGQVQSKTNGWMDRLII